MGNFLGRINRKYSYIRPLIWFKIYTIWSSLKFRFIGNRLVDGANIKSFKNVVFLLPRFMYLDAVFETSDEIIQSFMEYSSEAVRHVIFYDVDKIREDIPVAIERLRSLNPSHIVYLYGPNPSYSLSPEELRGFLCHYDAIKVAIFTDVIRISHLYMLYGMRRVFDIVVALDASIPFRFGKVAEVGPVMACISEKSFLNVIEPNVLKDKDIDLLILGTMYDERRSIVELLRSRNIDVVSSGGTYDSTRLSYEEYYRLSGRAKIRLVTSYTEKRNAQINTNSAQLKAHVAEAIASRSLLLVDSSFPASIFLKEGIDFICFSSKEDLLAKVEYFLKNEEEREAIAASAHEKWKNNYMGRHFWEYIIEKAINPSYGERNIGG